MNRALKVVLLVLLGAAVLVLLFTVVFPAVERYFEDPTLGADLPPAVVGLLLG